MTKVVNYTKNPKKPLITSTLYFCQSCHLPLLLHPKTFKRGISFIQEQHDPAECTKYGSMFGLIDIEKFKRRCKEMKKAKEEREEFEEYKKAKELATVLTELK